MLKELHQNSIQAGRKYRLSLICLLALFCGFVCVAANPAFTPVFAELVGGVVGILVVYCGGNVTNKFVTKPQIEKEEGS